MTDRDYAGLVQDLLDFSNPSYYATGTTFFEYPIAVRAADAIEELCAELEEYKRSDKLAVKTIDSMAEQLASAPRWISVEERLPEKWKPVLAYDGSGNGEIGIAFIVGSLKTVVWRGVGFTNTGYPPDVTHWMPLPEPPMEVVEP